MANKYKDKDGWLVRYKGYDGKWKSIRVGKNASATEAETLRKMYDTQELNRRHDQVVSIIAMDLENALQNYRDKIIPMSNTGRPKSHKSIQRYKAIVNNFIEWFADNKIKTFSDVRENNIITFFQYMVDGLHRSASTIEKHRQILCSGLLFLTVF